MYNNSSSQKQSQYIFFTIIDHHVQGPGATRGKVSQIRRHSICLFVGTITVEPRLEQIKNAVIGETFSWKSDPQTSGLWEDDA